ncbi:MAG: 30S ribosomal protein S9 [Candidatus Omnitrophota bacterium]|nr:30S ribosomal protein S9 [Candidatus Omnitrophota bacterium]
MTEVLRYTAVGRRKEAVARVTLIPGSGLIDVNGRKFENYFPRETDRLLIKQPLELTSTLNKFDILARLSGGGPSGQAGALLLALARAVTKVDEANKVALRKEGLLRRDPRMKERKKPGQKGARKRFQWTKR